MLTCKEMTELMTDYLEGRLPFMRRVSFQMHIGMCRHCREYLRQLKLTKEAAAKAPPPPIPPAVRDELLKRFKDWKK